MHCGVSNKSKVSPFPTLDLDIYLSYFFKYVILHLKCVQHVPWWNLPLFAANEEYYQMLMINDSQPPGFDVSSYTIEEINSITSEYTLKNTVSKWIFRKYCID